MSFASSITGTERSFIAGFLEGDAGFTIPERNGGQSYACEVIVKQRDDEQDLLESLVALTGVGLLRRVPARATSRPQISWTISKQEHCAELIRLLDGHGFHGRRASEWHIWRRAVEHWLDGDGDARRAALRAAKAELEAARRFGGGAAQAAPFAGVNECTGYITGFVCAEGSFGVWRRRARFSLHVRLDDRPLLALLATTTGLGRVYEQPARPPLCPNPSCTWAISAPQQLEALIELLRTGGLPGRKRRELESWAIAVDELYAARRLGVRPRGAILDSAAERLAATREYHAPSRDELSQPPGRDLCAESLRALQEWSREHAGALSCTDYIRWRREHRSAPTRNTVTRQFGSWYAALSAAGLADRAVRHVMRAGGEEARRERRIEQRAKVVAAVRRYESEHGRSPRALEFFRWRLAAAPATPTQGTIYKLFPGGWDEVLVAAAREAG